MVTNRGVIPSSTTPVSDKNGKITNPWYFYVQTLAQQIQNQVGPFISDGSSGTFGPTTIFQGNSGSLGIGTTGDIFFASDNGTIYVNIAGTWHAMIPAFTGDVTNTAGSNVLTLTSVNPDIGTFFNPTVTVDAQGRITAISSGASGASSVGSQGTIQLAGSTPGSFDGDQTSFTYTYLFGPPTLTVGNIAFAGPFINLLGTPSVGNLAQINSNTTLDLIGVEGLQLRTGATLWVQLDVSGSIELQGLAGTTGQVWTSQGTGSPTLWTSVVNSFNTRTGAVTLTSGDVTTALGYTPGTVSSVGVSTTTLTLGGTNPVTTSGTISVDLSTTAVTPGSYTLTDLTVDTYGRITAASNGVPAPVYTLTTLPTPVAGFIITVSNANAGAGALCYSDGVTWKDAGTHATVA